MNLFPFLGDRHLSALFVEFVDLDHRTRAKLIAEARVDLDEIAQSQGEVPPPDDFVEDFGTHLEADRHNITATRGLLEIWPTPLLWLVFGLAGVAVVMLPLLIFRAYEQYEVYGRASSWADAWRDAVASTRPVPRLLGTRAMGLIYLIVGWMLGHLVSGGLVGRSRRLLRPVATGALVLVGVGAVLILIGSRA